MGNSPLVRIPNPTVDSDLLEKVHTWIRAGIILDDIIERLRLQTVPTGYTVHAWTEGTFTRIHCLI